MMESTKPQAFGKDKPTGWYRQHLERSVACGCCEDKPSKVCDLGEALWRLKKRHEKERGGYA